MKFKETNSSEIVRWFSPDKYTILLMIKNNGKVKDYRYNGEPGVIIDAMNRFNAVKNISSAKWKVFKDFSALFNDKNLIKDEPEPSEEERQRIIQGLKDIRRMI